MIFDGAGQPLQLAEFDVPSLQPGEILVEILCCTLCGSDVHTFSGARSTPCPTIPGHEILGRIAELSTDIVSQGLQIGDRVTWSVAASCGECFFCQRQLPQKCEHLVKYGHERVTDAAPLRGGLAEHCVLAAGTAVFKVPTELPDTVACPANCATATVAGALRTAGDVQDQAVLVMGAGMLGLTAAAMARHRGAAQVIVCDIDPQRLAMAEQFGATHVALGEDVRSLVDQMTAGRGVDAVLEVSGSPDATELGLNLLRIGGRMILVGAVFPGRALQVDAEQVVRRLLRIEGLHNYRPDDLAAALEFLAATWKRYPFEELVSMTFPLQDAQAAFEHAVATKPFRVAVIPG